MQPSTEQAEPEVEASDPELSIHPSRHYSKKKGTTGTTNGVEDGEFGQDERGKPRADAGQSIHGDMVRAAGRCCPSHPGAFHPGRGLAMTHTTVLPLVAGGQKKSNYRAPLLCQCGRY